MAATGYTPIILFNSTTAANVPTTSNLAVGELAINIPDGKLYYNKSGTITLLANANASAPVTTFSAGTTGFTPSTATSGAVTLAGTLAIANGGTGASTLAGANIAVTNAANTFSATQTFTGTTATASIKTNNIDELASIVAGAPASTQAFYINTGAVQYYTSNAANNWTVNFAFSSGTSLNTAMAVGDSISVTMLTTQSATAYYNSAVQVDGSSVTPKWQGGTAPTSGNASGIDSYTYVIIKTASATYTVLASQTKFA